MVRFRGTSGHWALRRVRRSLALRPNALQFHTRQFHPNSSQKWRSHRLHDHRHYRHLEWRRRRIWPRNTRKQNFNFQAGHHARVAPTQIKKSSEWTRTFFGVAQPASTASTASTIHCGKGKLVISDISFQLELPNYLAYFWGLTSRILQIKYSCYVSLKVVSSVFFASLFCYWVTLRFSIIFWPKIVWGHDDNSSGSYQDNEEQTSAW